MKQKPKFVTKLFAAIDGYADIKAENEQQALNLSLVARDVVKPVIEKHNGVWMHEKNGEIFANYMLPEDAVKCAVALQREMIGKTDFKLRIGIHTGDIKSGIGTGDIVASGIAKMAASGGVCVSGKVYATIQSKTDVKAEFFEEIKIDGVDRPVRVYELIGEGLVEHNSQSKANEHMKKSGAKPSIAVLPFVNMSADPEQEYFCDGMAEEIINALTHIEDLRVIARTSTFYFKGKDVKVQDIGKELEVETVLEGSVRKAGNKLRITAQLINISDVSHLWSEKFDRDIEDIFAIQDEISLAIVESLKVKLLKKEKAAVVKRHTKDTDAYDLYLLGRYYWNKRFEGVLIKSLEYFNQAIAKDPEFALAYVGIADSNNILGFWGTFPPYEAYKHAEKAAEKALELDDTLAEAYATLGYCNCFYNWDWENSEIRFKRAINLNPNCATAHYYYVNYLLAMGRFNEALTEIRQAQKLDPLSMIIYHLSILVYRYLGRLDDAWKQYHKAMEIDPNFGIIHFSIGLLNAQENEYIKAIEAFRKAIELKGGYYWLHGSLGYVLGKFGERKKCIKILQNLLDLRKKKYVSSVSIALNYIGLDNIDKTFEWLERAYKERDPLIIFLKCFHEWDPLRSDPRFKALLKKMNLPDD